METNEYNELEHIDTEHFDEFLEYVQSQEPNTGKKKFDEFKTWITDAAKKCPKEWRYGQSLYNLLYKMFPSIVNKTTLLCDSDCFYDDKKAERFLTDVFMVYCEDR